jgi:16S rRNA (guanine966-N2)-methyltransferase
VAEVSAYLGKPGVDGPFDLVFLDPPYALEADVLRGHLDALDSSSRLAEGWTVVVTRGQKGPLPAAPLHWDARRRLRYGDSLLICYREVGWA